MIWTSPMDPVVVDGTSVGDAVAAAVDAHADRVALVDGPSGASVTYAELGRRIGRIAAWLLADGLGPGGCLAVWAPNVPAAAAVHDRRDEHRCPRHRGQPGLDRRRGRRPARRLRRVGGRHGAGARRSRPWHGCPPCGGARRSAGRRRPRRAARGSARGSRIEVEPDAVALLPYSSGTTVLPKGVMLTHRQLVTVGRQVGASPPTTTT